MSGMDEIDWILRNTPEPEPLKPITSEYQRALIESLASRRAALMIKGERPVAVKLMPEEIREFMRYGDLTGSVTQAMAQPEARLFGMAVIETIGPIALSDRFVLDHH